MCGSCEEGWFDGWAHELNLLRVVIIMYIAKRFSGHRHNMKVASRLWQPLTGGTYQGFESGVFQVCSTSAGSRVNAVGWLPTRIGGVFHSSCTVGFSALVWKQEHWQPPPPQGFFFSVGG